MIEELKFFGKIHTQKKKFRGGEGLGRGGGVGLVGLGQGGCERRIDVFVKIKKKKYFFFGGGWGRVGGGGRVRGGAGWWGVRVDVNEE